MKITSFTVLEMFPGAYSGPYAMTKIFIGAVTHILFLVTPVHTPT